MFFPRRIFVFFPVQPLPKFSNTLLSVPEHKGYITMRWVNRNQMSFKPNMLPNRLRCFCPESGACTFMWQTNSTKRKDKMVIKYICVREDLNRKKTFSFGHCPNPLTPPPDPNLGNLVLFFWTSKFKI